MVKVMAEPLPARVLMAPAKKLPTIAIR